MKRRGFTLFASLLVMAMLAVACGSDDDATTTAATTTAAPTTAAPTTAAPTTAAPTTAAPAEEAVTGDLVWWSDWTIEQTEAFIEVFEEAQPGINVEYLRSDDAEMFDRMMVQGGAGNIEADIVIIGWDGFSQIFDAEGWLHKYESPHADAYPEEIRGEGGSYYTYGSLLEGMCYNTEILDELGLDAPVDWEDLANPEYKGQLTIQDPLKVGSGAHDLMIELRGFWDDDERWETFFSGMGANDVTVLPDSTQAQQLVVQGEYGIDALCYLDFVQPSIDAGAPVVWVAPEPVITVPFTVNIPFSAPNKPAAEAFVDFILSEDGQAAVATVVGQVPARPGAPFPEPALVADGKTQIAALSTEFAIDEYNNNPDYYVEKAKVWFDLR